MGSDSSKTEEEDQFRSAMSTGLLEIKMDFNGYRAKFQN